MSIVPVFFASVSALSFEVLLNRAFAMTQWSHLAFLVISIALFGFSAGGLTVHARHANKKLTIGTDRLITWLPLVLALSIPWSWICANALPFDSIQLPFSALQLLYLCVLYMLLAIPFYLAGYITAYVFWLMPEKAGFVYAASMSGSAVGALVPTLLLSMVGFPGCIIITACISTVPVMVSQSNRRIGLPLSFGTCALTAMLISFPQLIEPKASSYKELARYILHPGARITHSHDTINGRVDVLESPSMRYAPGLSLNFKGTLPRQSGIFVDNGASLTISNIASPTDFIFVESSLAAAPFALVEDPARILVAVAGGGHLLLSALSSENADVTVLDQIPARAQITQAKYAAFSPAVKSGPQRAAMGQARGTFDIISLDHVGSSNPALLSLYEDYLITIESIELLFNHVAPDGVLFIMRKLLVPPSDSLKVVATVYAALKNGKIDDPTQHFAMLRSWDMYALLIAKKPLGSGLTSALRTFAETNSFDLVYLPGIHPSEVNQFNRRPVPVHYQSLQALLYELKNEVSSFSKQYYLNIRPATDNRPYINHHIRWSKIKELYNATGKRFYTMLFAGEVLIAAAFVVALVLSIFFFIVPVYVAARRSKRRSATLLEPPIYRAGVLCVFLLLGTGYMFFEIAWIKKIIMLSGSPSLSFTAVLTLVLICSGLGGFLSQKVSKKHITPIALATALLVATAFLAMEFVIPILSTMPHPLPLALSCSLLIPSAVFLGMPLPLTMRCICHSGRTRVLGWVANGVASVLSSIAAAAVALFVGIIELLFFSAAAYVLVCVLLYALSKKPGYLIGRKVR